MYSGVTTDPAGPAMRGAQAEGPIRNTLSFLLTSNAYLFPLRFSSLSTSDASDKTCSRSRLIERMWSMNCGPQPSHQLAALINCLGLLRNKTSMSSVDAGMGTEGQTMCIEQNILDAISSVSRSSKSLAAGVLPQTPLWSSQRPLRILCLRSLL